MNKKELINPQERTMIIDMHYHLEERIETVDRLLKEMDNNSIEKTVLIATLVDPFRVAGVAEKLSNFARMTLLWKRNTIGLLTYKSTLTNKGQFNILGKKFNIYQIPDNETVQKVMDLYPDRFLGWIFINPGAADPIKEINKYIEKPGWIGVKSHLFWHKCSLNLFDDAATLCSEKGVPMLLHLGADKEDGDYTYLPEKYPNLKIIYAHGGVPHYRNLWAYIKSKPNVYVDISGPYLNEAMRKMIVQELGAAKCIYGTDGPYGYEDREGQYNRVEILDEINRLSITDDERERILRGNFEEIIS